MLPFRIVLSPEEFDEFERVMKTPGEPTPAMIEAAKFHKKMREMNESE